MAADITLSVHEITSTVRLTAHGVESVTFQCAEGGQMPPYTGEYEVTPRFDAQVLQTKDKTLTNDIQFRAIPVSRTSNPSGGKTIYIGEI